MKTLQNNFTTPEQSKRLLELGVPADSADCYITQNKDIGSKLTEIHILKRSYSALLAHYNEMAQKEEMYINITPCWSVGRLIEIYCIARDVDFIEFDIFADGTNILSQIIKRIEDKIKELDFSKLED